MRTPVQKPPAKTLAWLLFLISTAGGLWAAWNSGREKQPVTEVA